jgi:hypothetical protein
VAGRFPLFTDIDVDGPLIKGLIRKGWDVVREERMTRGEMIESFEAFARATNPFEYPIRYITPKPL